jgi:hypothetical protein
LAGGAVGQWQDVRDQRPGVYDSGQWSVPSFGCRGGVFPPEYQKTLDILTESETKVTNVYITLKKISKLINIVVRVLLFLIAVGFLSYANGIIPNIQPSNLIWRILTSVIASAAVILNLARPLLDLNL